MIALLLILIAIFAVAVTGFLCQRAGYEAGCRDTHEAAFAAGRIAMENEICAALLTTPEGIRGAILMQRIDRLAVSEAVKPKHP